MHKVGRCSSIFAFVASRVRTPPNPTHRPFVIDEPTWPPSPAALSTHISRTRLFISVTSSSSWVPLNRPASCCAPGSFASTEHASRPALWQQTSARPFETGRRRCRSRCAASASKAGSSMTSRFLRYWLSSTETGALTRPIPGSGGGRMPIVPTTSRSVAATTPLSSSTGIQERRSSPVGYFPC